MIVASNSVWKYASDRSMIKFYRQSCLKKGWANLIDEINKPGQTHALKCFKMFMDEIQIIGE